MNAVTWKEAFPAIYRNISPEASANSATRLPSDWFLPFVNSPHLRHSTRQGELLVYELNAEASFGAMRDRLPLACYVAGA